jgi:hypothetical protein
MPSAHDHARRQELLDRLERLTPDRPARWGRFMASRMVLHLADALRMANGELAVRPKRLPMKFILRPLMLHVLPFPKGAPTAPELLARTPESWERDVGALRALLAAVEAPAPGTRLPDHPIFGRMSAHDWGTLIYKHADHHFRQFGI